MLDIFPYITIAFFLCASNFTLGDSSSPSSHLLESELSKLEGPLPSLQALQFLPFSGSQAPSSATHFVPEVISATPLSSHAHSSTA
jgi:hypothetical protein